MVVGQRSAFVEQFVTPDAIAEIHTAQKTNLREVGQNAPYGGFVMSRGPKLLHELLMGHGAAVLMKHNQHGDSRRSPPKAMRPKELSYLCLNVFGCAAHRALLRAADPSILVVDRGRRS